MSFDKIEFVKPNDILQGGFNPNLPAEITVTEQLLYSIANNLAILNNNLINSGALQNLALIGDLLQEVFTDDRVENRKTSVFKTDENIPGTQANQSVFVGDFTGYYPNQYNFERISISSMLYRTQRNMQNLWVTKSTGAVVNQASSTYSFNVPVPSVSVSSSPATVNVNASAPIVNNNVPVPHVTNNVEVAAAVPDITVNATAPVVNNNVPVPSVTNEVTVQSATPTIEVNSTAPVVNVASSPATVNVSASAPIVNNNVPVPTVNVSATAPIVNNNVPVPTVSVSSSPATVNVSPDVNVEAYDDSALIAKIEEMRELLEDALLTDVDTDVKKGLTDVIFERDSVNLIDYPVEVLTEPATTKKLRSF